MSGTVRKAVVMVGKPGQRLAVGYKCRWGGHSWGKEEGGWVAGTAHGRGGGQA